MSATATNSSSAGSQIRTPIEALSALLAIYSKCDLRKKDVRDEFLVATNLTQTAQKLFTGAGERREMLVGATAQCLNTLSELPWRSVHFPVAQTLVSQTYSDIFTQNHVRDSDKYKILLESLYTFLILVKGNPELAREDILRSIVEEGALGVQVAKSPELNYRANVLKIFSPNKISAIDLEPLQIIIYRGELIGGGFGPELWGLAYISGDRAHVLLETGEYVTLPSVSLCLATTHDYDTSELPPYLLACAKIFMPNMLAKAIGNQTAQEIADKLSKVLGSFSPSPLVFEMPASDIQSCADVLDAARYGVHATANQGAMRTFRVPGTELQIVVTAQQAAVRPYITPTLVDANSGKIYMRLDVPREFSAFGIYFFPFANQPTALTII